ncbi:MAG: YicC/YloC family endoribonuclease [Candidatus Acidiferrales bacterium]|jgi:uncharacterized protein (TIGR00255 family)
MKAAPAAAAHVLRSMTGFAQSRVETPVWNLRLTLRTVNHRFLDLHLHLPDGFDALEPDIRGIVRERVRRGHVDVKLYCEPAGPAAVGVHREVAAEYLKIAESLRQQFKMRAEPDIAAILRLPGVIAAPVASVEEGFAAVTALVTQCLREALDHLNDMRESEGRHLAEELSQGLLRITALTEEIEPLAALARPAHARRLESRMRELLGDVSIDPTRLAQEAAIQAERGDTAEELARLRSHVKQFGSLLLGHGETGKKLDFLLQEMQREANTLLSKTPGNEEGGIEITRLALEVKSEIEKLREQVQNIE